MTALVRPDVWWSMSWIDTVNDFGGTEEMNGSCHWLLDDISATPAGCQQFVDVVLAHETPQPGSSLVASTAYWITAADESDRAGAIGFLHLRHELNEFLLEEGGHIGYSVRPSRRREGHASRALGLGLRAAANIGIEQALVTCDVGNDHSRRIIERNGGVLENISNDKRRYWIDTDRPPLE